jgi:hypothetical protein
MPFHIEVSAGLHHARSFNLTAEELRLTVLEPWLAGQPIALGDRRWEPRQAELRILEGPELSNPELSFGQGWSNAERASQEVTGDVLDAAQEARGRKAGPAALVIEADSAVQTVAELASRYQAQSVDLESLAGKTDGRDPKVAAVIVVIQR